MLRLSVCRHWLHLNVEWNIIIQLRRIEPANVKMVLITNADQASLCSRAVSTEPSQFAPTVKGTRGSYRQSDGDLTSLSGCACAFEWSPTARRLGPFPRERLNSICERTQCVSLTSECSAISVQKVVTTSINVQDTEIMSINSMLARIRNIILRNKVWHFLAVLSICGRAGKTSRLC